MIFDAFNHMLFAQYILFNHICSYLTALRHNLSAQCRFQLKFQTFLEFSLFSVDRVRLINGTPSAGNLTTARNPGSSLKIKPSQVKA